MDVIPYYDFIDCLKNELINIIEVEIVLNEKLGNDKSCFLFCAQHKIQMD
jgi:hypothetical protein